MSSTRLTRRAQRAMARYGLIFFCWLFKWLPFGFVRFIGRGLIGLGFRLTIRQRQIAEESLQIAFKDEKSPDEIQRIIKLCFENLGWGMVEMFYYLSHPDRVSSCVTYEGKEHLDAALKEGKGVIAVTAHFGNFPLMMLACAQAGYTTNSIIQPARDEKLEEYLYKKRKEVGLKTVYAKPRQRCVSDSIKVLRNNEILFVPLDQNFGTSGVFVEFFGQKAATATGPIIFARRTGAPIVPMFIVRENENQHKIIIEKPFELEEIEDEQEMILANIARLTKLIEGYIRKYPHEWGWMHRRWKSRPYLIKYCPNA